MNTKKRILYIESNQDGTIGGSHYCLLEIVKRIDKKKYVPIVYFYQNNRLANEFGNYCEVIIRDTEKGIIVKNDYPSIYMFFSRNTVLLKILLTIQKLYNFVFGHLAYYLRVFYILHKYKIDIIHMNDIPVLMHWLVGAKLYRITCISHLRGNWVPTRLQNILSKRYDCLISISQSVLDFVKNQGVETSNIVKIYDGIDTKTVLLSKTKNRSDVRQELGLSENEFVIGVIGNIKRWKGQHVALEAVHQLSREGCDVKCIIVGDVSSMKDDRNYYEYLNQYVKDNEIEKNIIFTGYRNDIPDIMSSLDVVILTSTDPEPLGRVVLEGMLFERPVIATAHGGPAEIIVDGVTGYLTQPFDSKMLSQKIKSIKSDPETGMQIGMSARKEVEENYDISVNVKNIEKVYSRYS